MFRNCSEEGRQLLSCQSLSVWKYVSDGVNVDVSLTRCRFSDWRGFFCKLLWNLIQRLDPSATLKFSWKDWPEIEICFIEISTHGASRQCKWFLLELGFSHWYELTDFLRSLLKIICAGWWGHEYLTKEIYNTFKSCPVSFHLFPIKSVDAVMFLGQSRILMWRKAETGDQCVNFRMRDLIWLDKTWEVIPVHRLILIWKERSRK